MPDARVADRLVNAVGMLRGGAAADRLCAACVQLLEIDAATVSLVAGGATTGTLGVSGPTARTYGEVPFTVGEGPCLDCVRDRGVIAAQDLSVEFRWPAYTSAMLDYGIRSVVALPVVLGGEHVGALDVYRHHPGPISTGQMTALLMAAELAAMPLLDLLSADHAQAGNDPDSDPWTELGALTRTEVNQATGMLIAQLGVTPAEALIRLRAHAFATGASASATARAILDRRLRLDTDF